MPFQLGANNEGDSIICMSTDLDAAQAIRRTNGHLI